MKTRALLLFALIAAVVCYFVFDLGRFLQLDYLKSQQAALDAMYASQPAKFIGVFFAVYVIATALSVPGAVIMTLAAGALFGLGIGTLVVSFASSIGATLAFLVARFLFANAVESRFGDKLKTINRNVQRDGAFYLFTLRLVPVFPFFLINLAMGLTRIGTLVFYLVSQVGMLPGTLVYVNAGTQLARIEKPGDILSPTLLLSFVLLGVFPLVARKIVTMLKHRKRYAGYTKPEHFDRDIVVLGAGSGGLVTAYIGAAVKAKVSLIEKHRMGGDCLNTGCVPSKALIRSARLMNEINHAERFGVQQASGRIDFARTMRRVHEVIGRIAPHDSVERYESLGVDVIEGEGRISSPWTVEVNGRTLRTRRIVVATGSTPLIPPIEGLDQVRYLTSENLWELDTQPRRLMVLGGGPIGCELAQAFCRLGSEVTLVERESRILLREDEDIAELVRSRFRDEGIALYTGSTAAGVRLAENGDKWLRCERDGEHLELPFDEIIVAVGRHPSSRGFGLEELGIRMRDNGTIETNDFLQTDLPNIYAVGDVAGPFQFTHTAAHQAWYAAVNSLFGFAKKFRADYRVIPWATFTDPEIARVGLNERDAEQQNVRYELTSYGIDDLDRAIADSHDHGVIKVLTPPGKDRILGVTIAADHAGDLIAEYVLAMKHGIGLNKILGTIHIYPTMAEMNKFAAGEWRRRHQPERLLAWLQRFHAWRRGDYRNRAKAVTEADDTSA